jgi:hypothetical protein
MSKPRKLITKDFLKSVNKFSVTTGCISEGIVYFSYNSTLYMNAVFWLVDKHGDEDGAPNKDKDFFFYIECLKFKVNSVVTKMYMFFHDTGSLIQSPRVF